MLTEFISNFNWIDIFILAVFCRIVFLGMHSNLLSEIFSLLGAAVALFITMHYYIRFADFLHNMVFVPLMIADVFAFIILWLTVDVLFKIIGAGWKLMIRTEVHPLVNQWGGVVLGSARAAVVCSMIFAMFIITGSHYVLQMVDRTLTGKVLIDLAPKVYTSILDGVMVKYFPDEPMNEYAINLRDKIEEDKKKHEKK